MDCVGDWVCGVVCSGLWIGGLVYGVCEAEGFCAVCDLSDYFGGGGVVFCFADGVRRIHHRGHGEHRGPGGEIGKSTSLSVGNWRVGLAGWKLALPVA